MVTVVGHLILELHSLGNLDDSRSLHSRIGQRRSCEVSPKSLEDGIGERWDVTTDVTIGQLW